MAHASVNLAVSCTVVSFQNPITYGYDITKVECTNHAVKCYRNRFETLCKGDEPQYQGHDGLIIAMKRITHGARCAIRMHTTTGDVSALWHDLTNGPHHCFGDHQNCNSAFCKHVNEKPESKLHLHYSL